MVKEILQTMGRRVRVLREERRLTQLELAAAIRKRGVDCSNSLISSIETGRANPSLEVFVAIADELDVTLDYLATRTDRIESPRAEDIEDTGHGITEEAQRAAVLVDLLPAWRRQELLSWLEGIAHVNEAARVEAHAAADLLLRALGLDGAISPQATSLIEGGFSPLRRRARCRRL